MTTTPIVAVQLTPEQTLAAARLLARETMPYFQAALLSLVPRPQPGLGTLGVSERLVMYYDPEVVQEWGVKYTAAALIHELLHPLRDHAGRCKALAADPRLFNVAGDCEINDDLVNLHFPDGTPVVLPPAPGHQEGEGKDGRCYPSVYGLPDGKLAEEYYTALRQKAQDGSICGLPGVPCPGGATGQGDGGNGQGGDAGASGGPSQKPHVGAGWCGSAGANPLPCEEPGQGGPGQGGPGQGQDGDGGRSSAEVASIRREVAEAAQAHAAQKGRGSVPAGLLRWAEAALAPPKVRWQDKLARAARNAVEWVRGAQDYRYGYISKRQLAVGYGVGHPIFPALRAPVPKVAIGRDTSGSMGELELTAGLRESAGIMKATGAELTFLDCDAKVHGPPRRTRRWQDLVKHLGGGGTDFRPIFEAVEQLKPRPDVFVFITDGQGPAPAKPPPGMKVIWLLVGKHRQHAADWGDEIELED
jgi:predicted metal-dependent peptidase